MSKITKITLSAPEAFSCDYVHCGVQSAPNTSEMNLFNCL